MAGIGGVGRGGGFDVGGEDPDTVAATPRAHRTGTPRGDRGEANHLVDHGGRVLAHVDVAPVYLGGYWQTPQGAADRSHNDAALSELVTNPGMTALWKQYRAGAGTRSESVTLPTVDPRAINQRQLEALVKQQIKEGKFDASKRDRVFTFVLPPGCELESSGGATSRFGLGGYHGSVTVGGREVYYAAVAYSERRAGGVNGIDFTGNARDNVSIAESHEITEAVTDPDVELAQRLRDRSKLGWYDDVTGKGEIGDIPVIDAERAGDHALRSVWGRSGGFAFQKEWSNDDGKSEL